MYPSGSNPAFGSFVKELDLEIAEILDRENLKAVIKSNKKGKLTTPIKYLNLFILILLKSIFGNFNVIYGHYIFPTGAFGLIPKYLRRKPLVITSHGGDIRIPAKFRFLKKPIRFTLERSDHIIAVSEYVKGQLIADFGIDKAKISVINCGVNTSRFTPLNKTDCRKQLGLPLDKKIILYVGNLIERKGVKTLIDSFAALKTDDVLLYIIGEGELKKELADRANGYSLSDKVIFEKYKTREELPYWYSAVDIFVLPSKLEPFGLVAIEAMACGVPVIVSRVGGLPEFVVDGHNGYTFTVSDQKELTAKIETLLSLKPYEYQLLSDNAVATADVNSITTQATKILAVFDRSIAKRRTKSLL